MKLLPKLTLLTIFGIAMAHLEAVIVVYIRKILQVDVTTIEGFSLDLIPGWLMSIEKLREAMTIVMLIALAFLAGKNKLEKLAVFLWAFAIWDIFYYVSLYVTVKWPPSLAALDVLFLIPKPWVAPVYLPVAISLAMLTASGWMFRRCYGY